MAATPNSSISGLQKTTNYRVVLPFYLYAAFGLLVSTVMLLFHTEAVGLHYFNPAILAITHTMAIAWGTMMIMGASHQLLPVLIEGSLESEPMAYISFAFCGIGTPFLIYGFYNFNLGFPLQFGAILVNIGVISFLANVWGSSFRKKILNIHAVYVVTSTIWLFSTTFFGLLLVLNFTHPFLARNSVDYLAIHAHLGLLGWFLLLIIGVGSRLIPMFLISKYQNNKILWLIYGLINASIISYIIIFLVGADSTPHFIPYFLAVIGLILFISYIYQSYLVRIRKKVDQQMKTSLISVGMMLLPPLILVLIGASLVGQKSPTWPMLYGFCLFFGWITAIILGMTFKTLPFIIWNKVYHQKPNKGTAPAPKDLFNENIYRIMLFLYLAGFVLFGVGLILSHDLTLRLGVIALLFSAILYVYNVILLATHQSKKHENK